MNLAPAIALWPVLVSGLLGITAVWRDARRPVAGPTAPALAFLSLRDIETIGHDERRVDFDEDRELEEFKDIVVGQRRATLRVLVECYDRNSAVAIPPWARLESLRTKLKFDAPRAQLRAVDWMPLQKTTITDTTSALAENVVASAVLDLPCRFVCREAELEGYTYIASISGTMTLGAVEQDFEAELEEET